MFQKMPQAWDARLTPKEVSMVKILYNDARLQQGIYSRMTKLVLTSMAPGTVSNTI